MMQQKAKTLGKLLDSWKYLYQNDEVRMFNPSIAPSENWC